MRSCRALRVQREDMLWRSQSCGGLRPGQQAWSVFPSPTSPTHVPGRKEETASQIFLPEWLLSSGEFHSNGLLGLCWKKTLSLFSFYVRLKLGAACDPGV